VLQEVDGRSWRDKLPKIPSFSSLSSLLLDPAASSGVATPPVLPPSPEDIFERYKTEGNTLFGKV